MKEWHCLAVVEGSDTLASLPSNCRTETYSDLNLSLIWAPHKKKMWSPGGQKTMASALLDYQRLLETVQKGVRILPGQFGKPLSDQLRKDATASLAAFETALRHALSNFGHLRQYQISLGWSVPDVLKLMQQNGTGTQTSVQSQDALQDHIDGLIQTARAKAGDLFDRHITPMCQDTSTLPHDGHEDGLRRVVLIEASQEDALFKALEAFDADLFTETKIQMAGPLPALSFACVVPARFYKPEIDGALARLGLTKDFTEDALQAAFKAKAFASHADTAQTHQAHPQNGYSSDLAALKEDRDQLATWRIARDFGSSVGWFIGAPE